MTPVKAAICSFGLSGRVFHAPFLHLHPGFELYSVMERSKDLAKAIYPTVHTPRTLEELLDDKAVELVIVNTPNYTHYAFAKAALLAGKHVVVEKPFASTVAEAKELAALAATAGRKLSVFQNRRYDSDYKTVKKILGEGWLGKIVEAEIHYDRYVPALSPKSHKETPGPGTGIVYDLGTHVIDQALQLFGMPEAVFADLAITRPGSRVEDYMELLFHYPAVQNLRVRIKGGYFVREAVPAYIMHGVLGSFLKKRADPQEDQLVAGKLPGGKDWGTEPPEENGTDKGLLHTEKDGKTIRERVPTLQGNYLEYYDGIYEAIRNDKALPVTAEHGIMTMRIIEAAYESYKKKTLTPL
ncbi:MAG TPA: Gfo/Idh/MocA family oxidoreductase [Puia sp.]|nr:Gfo/Idh/MocA family oxidoreductase [Puia sp.]